MYKRLYEEEHKLHSTPSISVEAPPGFHPSTFRSPNDYLTELFFWLFGYLKIFFFSFLTEDGRTNLKLLLEGSQVW